MAYGQKQHNVNASPTEWTLLTRAELQLNIETGQNTNKKISLCVEEEIFCEHKVGQEKENNEFLKSLAFGVILNCF